MRSGFKQAGRSALLFSFLIFSFAASAAYARVAAPDPVQSSDKTGRFEGMALNNGQTGKVVLILSRIDRNGNVSASFNSYDGLCGDGVLTGKLNQQALTLQGVIACANYRANMLVQARFVGNDVIEARYGLVGQDNIRQQGQFRVARVGAGGRVGIGNNGGGFTETTPNNAPNAVAFYNRGVEAERAGRYKEALEAYGQAVKLKPDYAEAFYGIGTVLFIGAQKSANDDERTKAYNYAAVAFQKAAQLKPNYADAYLNLANVYLQLGRNDDAQTAARQTLAIDPNNAYAHVISGAAYYNTNKYEQAVGEYRQAIRLKPDLVDAYIALSGAYSNLSQYPQAIQASRDALRYDANNSVAYTNLSWFYSLTDQPQLSLEAAQNAVRINPKEQLAYTNMCRALTELNRPQEALNACNQAMQLKPGDPETYGYIGQAYNILNQKARSLENFKLSAEGFERATITDPDAYYLQGNAYLQLNRYEDAIAAYRRCLEVKPDFALPHLKLGLAYYLSGNRRAALEEYNRLKELDLSKAEKLSKVINSRR